MARQASVAVAGFYPTPESQVPRIAAFLWAQPQKKKEPNHYESARKIEVLDPCAGEGAAIGAIAESVVERSVAGLPEDEREGREIDSEFYTCEMEAGRHAVLKENFRSYADKNRALRGDVFRVAFETGSGRDSLRFPRAGHGVGLLYLNPPYDTDREHGRLEQKFLDRFTPALTPGGVLVFVVPYYALAASADTFGRYYRRLSCYRFSGVEFNAYKQVVLLAERSHAEVPPRHPRGEATREFVDLLEPDPGVIAQVNAWAADPSGILELPEAGAVAPPYEVPTAQHGDALAGWVMCDVDVKKLVAAHRPWHESTRARGLAPIARVLPDLPVAELLHRTYEVATPPRPAHIAAGLAAGLFNGQRIEPDDARSKLPALLVKGVFDREWRTVEEKLNKDGEKTGEVQVQQPKLVVTILDLDKHHYHTLAATVEKSGARAVSEMGIADLLQHYGQSLMGVMERQCKILYDPRRDAGKVEIPASPRRLFAAQAHAVRACVNLLRERPGRMPVLLGEIGSGKTFCSVMTARAEGAERLLVMCPPHLLETWRGEVAVVWPEAEVRVLESVLDVDAVASAPSDRPIVAVLSREVAKLGHAWEGVGAHCPGCGGPTGGKSVELAKRRARCEHRTILPKDDYAQMARRLALLLRPHLSRHVTGSVLRGGLDSRYPAPSSAPEWRGLPDDLVLELRAALAWACLDADCRSADGVKRALAWLQVAAPNAEHLVKLLPLVHSGSSYQNFAEELPLLLEPGGGEMAVARAAVATLVDGYSYSGVKPVDRLDVQVADCLAKGTEVNVAGLKVRRADGKLLVDGVEAGTPEAAGRLLDGVVALGSWAKSAPCGEPLYQAVPEPRRHPLAQYIVKRHKRTFDFLIVDETHEYANGDSAQGLAAHRLETIGWPTVAMTGSVMNGYASSLFANMWALSPEFRDEFDRGELSAFCDRYGYRKRLVQDRADGEVVSFGSQTDRVERSERDVGDAPGVLPLFLFRHLLPSAVTIHKADLQIELPPCSQERAEVEPGAKLLAEYTRLLNALKKQIKADRFTKDLAGKLFGALAELPSFLDRATADVGNGDGGAYEIRYPESCGGGLVASANLLSAKTILPKEEWMLDQVEAELAAGRNVMVFGWHLGLLPRLSRLIEERTGERAPVLYADKVPTGKRQAWIDREIVKKKRRVMVANPVCVQTGLNNLVHFATEIWHENPACNPITYRQAIGRVDRIGQRAPTRVVFGYYEGTLQEQMFDLLLAKVAISTATDGLDPESALRASGIVEDEFLTGLSIGKQLWAMIEGDFTGKNRKAA